MCYFKFIIFLNFLNFLSKPYLILCLSLLGLQQQLYHRFRRNLTLVVVASCLLLMPTYFFACFCLSFSCFIHFLFRGNKISFFASDFIRFCCITSNQQNKKKNNNKISINSNTLTLHVARNRSGCNTFLHCIPL